MKINELRTNYLVEKEKLQKIKEIPSMNKLDNRLDRKNNSSEGQEEYEGESFATCLKLELEKQESYLR
jgi:flagellar biogenesis protein FliO